MSKLVAAAAAFLIFGLIGGASTYAEVATDGTVGPRLPLEGPEFEIGADLGRRVGGNLFHSFERFSLDAGERATFSGPDQIRNVISRVTGGVRSDIDGTIRSTIPGADFYFLNPAGIAFGPTARLDLQGSFHVSTADEMRFTDGAKFSATDPAASSFTVARPEAFGFLGADPAPITADGSFLRVPPAEALSIVGGDIDITDGVIRTEAGRITLAAVGGAGEARPGSGAVDAAWKADISLTDAALVETSGDGGGMIRIRGGQLVVEKDSSIVADNTGSIDATVGIDVQAETVTILRDSRLTADVSGSGAGGDVSISASDVKIKRSFISSDVLGTGAGGDVIIIAKKLIILDDGDISTDAFGAGQGGAAIIMAKDLEIRNEGGISSMAFGTGDGGSIDITATRVNIDEGTISSETIGPGDAGRIRVTADKINLTDIGVISSSFFLLLFSEPISQRGPDFIETSVPVTISEVGMLIGIEIEIIQDLLGSINDFFLSQDGMVFFIEPNAFDGEDGVTFLPLGAGIAGDVFLRADELTIDNGFVGTDSAVSAGGRIVIEATGLINLIEADVISNGIRPGEGDSVITLRAPRITVNASRVMSLTTEGEPLAGSGEARLLGDLTVISADSEVAASSTVEITGQEADVGSQLVTLERAFLDTAPLRARCGARRDIGASSFTGVGRGGLPPDPDGPLAGAYVDDETAGGAARRAGSRLTTVTAPADVRLAGLSAPCAPLD